LRVSHVLVERLLLALAVAITRIAFRSERLYDLDSVNFALGLSKFDPWLHQPHPPAYYLYILTGRLMQWLFPDPNDALVAVSVAASVVAVLGLHELARAMYGGRSGLFAGLAFVLSPLCWFHGTVALTYIVEAAGAAIVGVLCWRTLQGDRRAALCSAMALAVLVGFRQSSILFLGPLWLYCISRKPRQMALPAVAFALTCVAWFTPMVVEAGGAERYFGALQNLWLGVPSKETVASQGAAAGFALGLARIATIGLILMLTLGAFVFAGLCRIRKPLPAERRKTFVLVWMAPGLAFFSAIYLIFVNSGYLLVITPPLFAWLGGVLDRYTRDAGRFEATAALAAGAALNICVFLWAPLYCSYKSVRAFERDLDRTVHDIRTHFRPERTLIVAFDAHFFGFRHAGYYLPEFVAIAYPAAGFHDGYGILSSGDRRTLRLAEPPSGFENIVFFPLPKGERYEEHFRENVLLTIGETRVTDFRAGGTDLRLANADSLAVLYRHQPRTEVHTTSTAEYKRSQQGAVKTAISSEIPSE
jgi:hypothetical protein